MESPEKGHSLGGPLNVFFGHHKCATGWITKILMEVCWHLGINFRIAHRRPDYASSGSLGQFARDNELDFLAYTNADRREISDLDFHKGFHVVRDPRDVVVSAYYSHLKTHPVKNWPQLVDHREKLKRLNKSDGLFAEFDFSWSNLEDMLRWNYSQENVLEIKMEDLTAQPVERFADIFSFLGMFDKDMEGPALVARKAQLRLNRLNHRTRRVMPGGVAILPSFRAPKIPADVLRSIVEAKSFKKLARGRKPGQEDTSSHLRKGVPGDWVNHFSDDHKRRFKELYNDLLLTLGYETDPAW